MPVHRMTIGAVVATILTCLTCLLSAPSAQAASKPTPKPEPLTFVSDATVETYDSTGTTVVSTQTYGQSTMGLVLSGGTSTSTGGAQMLDDSGSGGSTSASGCRRVTVSNRAHTLLGFTAFIYHTWTHWCWTRSTQNIYDVSTGWTISDVDPEYYWRGEVNRELLFYDYSVNDGHPRSAYKHYRQGRVENCVLKYGCIGNYYPANLLRSYYNGTWVWSTNV